MRAGDDIAIGKLAERDRDDDGRARANRRGTPSGLRPKESMVMRLVCDADKLRGALRMLA
jgi:hypothetical protein